jgi:hypothetical protein
LASSAFFSSVANDGEPPWLVVISLPFFPLGVADDGEPPLLIIISLFFFRCRRQRQTKQARRHLLHLSKKIGVKNKQIKRKVDVHLLAIDALVFLEERFLQHHFSNIFCNTVSTPLLQHCFNTPVQHYFLQQHFNIASIAPSFATLLLLLSDGEV